MIFSLFCGNGFGEGLGVARLSLPSFFLGEIIWFTVESFPSGSCELLWQIIHWICRRSWAPGCYLKMKMCRLKKTKPNYQTNLITIENFTIIIVRIQLVHGSEQAQLQSSLQEQQRVRSAAGFHFLSLFGYLATKRTCCHDHWEGKIFFS